MTNIFSLIQEFFRKKVYMIHIGICLEIIAMVIIYGRLWLFGKLSANHVIYQTMTIVLIATVIYYFELSVQMERIWVRNVYRLIPISDTRFYLANLSSNILTYAYFLIWQGILMFWPLSKMGDLGLTHLPIGTSLATLLLVVLTGIYGWVFITTINLLVKTIRNFMPAIQQTFAQVALSVVTVGVVVFLINGIVKLMNYFFGANTFNLDLNANSIALKMCATSAWMFLVIVIMTVLNAFLLKHVIETKIMNS